MSDVVDLTLISGLVEGTTRELRLLRLQMDNIASRIGGIEGRIGALETRVGTLEQSFHDLVGEVARGFGQVQQQLTRHEKRVDAVDAGLTALRAELADSTASIIQAIKDGR